MSCLKRGSTLRMTRKRLSLRSSAQSSTLSSTISKSKKANVLSPATSDLRKIRLVALWIGVWGKRFDLKTAKRRSTAVTTQTKSLKTKCRSGMPTAKTSPNYLTLTAKARRSKRQQTADSDWQQRLETGAVVSSTSRQTMLVKSSPSMISRLVTSSSPIQSSKTFTMSSGMLEWSRRFSNWRSPCSLTKVLEQDNWEKC